MNYPFHMTAINHYDKCYNSTGPSVRPTLEHPARVRHVEGFSKDINVIVTENILDRYDTLQSNSFKSLISFLYSKILPSFSKCFSRRETTTLEVANSSAIR